MVSSSSKSANAFRTIGEVADELGLQQHILRYWETRFPELRPLQRSGKRRYYRPEDVALAARINQLLNHEGYTIKGVQKMLAGEPAVMAAQRPDIAKPTKVAPSLIPALIAMRNRLAKALVEDDVAARI